MAKTPNRSVRLDPDLDAYVQAFADENHLPWSQALRVLMRRLIALLDQQAVTLPVPPAPQRKENQPCQSAAAVGSRPYQPRVSSATSSRDTEGRIVDPTMRKIRNRGWEPVRFPPPRNPKPED